MIISKMKNQNGWQLVVKSTDTPEQGEMVDLSFVQNVIKEVMYSILLGQQ
tara:strand:+ start:437 stop:586 length:150 start_codon:yes stop_codon:yes gene_type:complete